MRHGNNQQRVKEVKKDLIRIMGLPQDCKMDFKLFFPEKAEKEEKAPRAHAKAEKQEEPVPKAKYNNADKPARELKKYSVVASKSKPNRLASA